MPKLQLCRVDYKSTTSPTKYDDYNIFQSIDWINFVSHTQNAEPVFAIVKDGEVEVGRFTGLIIKKFGFRILGSSFPGWTTLYMGFNLDASVSVPDALNALENFAFIQLKCIHLEIFDRNISINDFQLAGYNYRLATSFEIDLSKSEEELLAAMKPKSCRYSIRKAEKLGVEIKIADDALFADDYYAQLEDVFAKQKLVPTYSKDRVKSLIEYLHPSGNLLLLRAIDQDGKSIGTGIFPALNNTMYLWGAASWREYQHLCPNEPLIWFAMRYWKKKGITKFDMGGGGEYKRKYGGIKIQVPWGRKSKFSAIESFRNLAKNTVSLGQRLKGWRKP